MKDLDCVNSAAWKELRELPDDLKAALGFQLHKLQMGDDPSDFRPMKTVGKGVFELRISDSLGNNVGRSFYVANLGNTIWVLHSFIKKAQKTPQKNIDLGSKRYKELLRLIEGEGNEK